ncbi:MAG: hypothetical protein M1514_00765 [Patescibacteria group bacterium]|nr:hypothetical protein [Patescibacteria group bacterium]
MWGWGLFLIISSWIVSWGRVFCFYPYSFLPLWIGYILTINGLSDYFIGKSLLSQMGKKFILLFIYSIPFWWIFEVLNHFTQNWHYILSIKVNPFEYFLSGSVFFSIVVPAIMSTNFFFYQILIRLKRHFWIKIPLTGLNLLIFFVFGLILTSFIFIFPKIGFLFMWVGPFLLIAPINYYLGFCSLLKKISLGDWTLFFSLFLASLFTGFWWELWNFYALPKWIYSVPYVGFLKIFEMPVLGYLGYLPFGLEVYSFTVFLQGILKRKFKNIPEISFDE